MAGKLNPEPLLFWQFFKKKVPKVKAFVRVIAPICLLHCDKISHPKTKKTRWSIEKKERGRERKRNGKRVNCRIRVDLGM
jgi:hypothetical protein